MTKYSAGVFLGLAIVIAILNAQRHQSSTGFLKEELSKKQSTTLPAAPQQPVAAPSSGTLPGTAAPGSQGTTTPTLQLTPQPPPQQGAGTPNATAPAVSQPANTPTATPNTPPANTGTKQP